MGTYKSSAERRRDRLSAALNLPSLKVEDWAKDHLCFVASAQKGKSRKKKPVAYKTAVQESLRKIDETTKRKIGIRVGDTIQFVVCYRMIDQWYDEETGERMARFETSQPFLGRTIITARLA